MYHYSVRPLLRQELGHHLHVFLPLLEMGSVARFSEHEPFDFRDGLEERQGRALIDLVVCAVNEESGHIDLVRFLDDPPVLDGTSDVKLRRSVPGGGINCSLPGAPRENLHCIVHRLLRICGEALKQFRRPRVQTAKMLFVKHGHCVLVFL